MTASSFTYTLLFFCICHIELLKFHDTTVFCIRAVVKHYFTVHFVLYQSKHMKQVFEEFSIKKNLSVQSMQMKEIVVCM